MEKNLPAFVTYSKHALSKTHSGMTKELCLTVIRLHHMQIENASSYLFYPKGTSLRRVGMILHAINVYAMHG